MKSSLSLLSAFWLAAIIALPSSLWAQRNTETVVREVPGYGRSYDEAVANALQEAARQIFGLSIAVDEIRVSTSSEHIVNDHSGFSATDELSRRAVLQTPSGIIRTYEVLSQRRDPQSNQLEVRLRVEATKFAGATGGGSENRLRIAILPPRAGKTQFNSGKAMAPANDVTSRWNQAIINEFVQSRKFAVLDREFVSEVMSELNIIASDAVPLNEQIRLGQQLGADFLLVGTLNDASLQATPYRIALTGESGVRHSARVDFSYRLIDVATREIRSANDFLKQWNEAELRSASVDAQNWMPILFKESGFAITNQIMEIIYPIRVLRASSRNQIILNQGGIGMQVGEQFDLFQTGEVLIDPYTGESLGAEEIFAGQIEVIRVQPKFSIARLISGDFELVEPGAICRRVPAATAPASPAPTPTPAAPARFTFPGQN